MLKAFPLGVFIAITGLAISFFQFAHNDLRSLRVRSHGRYGFTDGSIRQALGTDVAVSEESVQQIDGLLTRQVGKFMLKGMAQPIVVYELSSRIDEVDENRKESARFFLMLLPLSENSPG